jgi:hypothetical protein
MVNERLMTPYYYGMRPCFDTSGEYFRGGLVGISENQR